MNIINAIFLFLFNVLFYPFQRMHPVWGLLSISVLTGVLMPLIFKRISNQDGIRQTKNRIKAHLLEMRLYKDDIRLSIRAMLRIMLNNLRYLTYALKPMLVLMIPVLFILIYTGTRYGYRPVGVGEDVILTATLQEESGLQEIHLETPEEIHVETPPLRIPLEKKIYWRVRALKEGNFNIEIHLGEQIVKKEIIVGTGIRNLSSRRVKGNSIQVLFYPAESGLPSSSFVRSISIQYPPNKINIAGWAFNWLVLFFIFSILVGVGLKGVFHVEI